MADENCQAVSDRYQHSYHEVASTQLLRCLRVASPWPPSFDLASDNLTSPSNYCNLTDALREHETRDSSALSPFALRMGSVQDYSRIGHCETRTLYGMGESSHYVCRAPKCSLEKEVQAVDNKHRGISSRASFCKHKHRRTSQVPVNSDSLRNNSDRMQGCTKHTKSGKPLTIRAQASTARP